MGRVGFDWDEKSRILTIQYPPAETLDEALADEVVARVSSAAGPTADYVGVLVDLGKVPDASAGFRARVGDYFRANRTRTKIAVYNASPFMRTMTLLFSKGTGVPIRGFDEEKSARAWLERGMG